VYFFKLFFNEEEGITQADIIPYDIKMKKLEYFYKNIRCDYIDVVDVGEDGEISIICDDEGLLKSGNIVMDIHHESIHEPLSLAGTLLVGKNIQESDGIEIEGFRSQIELMNEIKKFKFEVRGITK